MKELSAKELEAFRMRINKLSNKTRYDEARALSLEMMKKYPDNVEFAFYEAVFEAEDEVGFTPQQIKKRHARAAQKLKPLLRRLRSLEPRLRGKLRNEYYWFSHQPKKQYALGQERVRRGEKRSYYSQGVGAAEQAKVYALRGKRGLALRWTKISEAAWLKFFEVNPNWFNSYFFYAAALGYQGRMSEMDAALARACKIAGKKSSWAGASLVRDEITQVLGVLERKSPRK